MPSRPPLDPPERRKARGAFFTPTALCEHMVAWAVRDPADRVLEPSCGEAAFLSAAADRLHTLGDPVGARLDGVELHRPSARAAAALVAASGIAGTVHSGDFFARRPRAEYDVVIGNPPYVRYQDFSGPQRTRARAAALQAGVRLSALASSWAPFTVHATAFLRPAGRLALVLPAELLSTNYAAAVRRHLMERFAQVRLVVFTERVFPEVQEEVVLLLAEGVGPTDHCELHQVHDAAELVSRSAISQWHPSEPTAKWTAALLDREGLAAYRHLSGHPRAGTLHDWGETTLGAVTGRNAFFALAQSAVSELALGEEDLVALSPPGSRHLRGLEFSPADWQGLRERDAAVWLFRPGDGPLSAGAARHVAAGAADGVDRAYKCRVRDPWWRVPHPPPADLLVTYMNADTPRLVHNRAGVHHLNSVHGLYLHDHIDRALSPLLPLAALNSLTLVGAETVGRAYGGGLLKLEPREADRLPLPTPTAVAAAADALERVRQPVAAALAAGRLRDAVALIDPIILGAQLAAGDDEIAALRASATTLAARRAARGAGR